MRFQRAEQTVAEHPRPLPDQHARQSAQAAVDFRHHAAERFLAHQHGADGVLLLLQAAENPPGVAAGNAEHHVDAGIAEHARDHVAGIGLLGHKVFHGHRHVLPDFS